MREQASRGRRSIQHAMAVAFVAFAMGVAAPSAEAQEVTGQRLIDFCTSENAPDLALCHGFFRGLSDTHSIYAAMGKGLHLYCLSKGVTQEQFERVAFNWMEANPDRLDRPAAVLIVQALHEGFPCDENGEAAAQEPSESAGAGPSEEGSD